MFQEKFALKFLIHAIAGQTVKDTKGHPASNARRMSRLAELSLLTAKKSGKTADIPF
jgi:hypothetical protein